MTAKSDAATARITDLANAPKMVQIQAAAALESVRNEMARRDKIRDLVVGNARNAHLGEVVTLHRTEPGPTQGGVAVWCENADHGTPGTAHFDQSDCLHPHCTDAATRERLNSELQHDISADVYVAELANYDGESLYAAVVNGKRTGTYFLNKTQAILDAIAQQHGSGDDHATASLYAARVLGVDLTD